MAERRCTFSFPEVNFSAPRTRDLRRLIDLLWVVAKHGNASLVAFVRVARVSLRVLKHRNAKARGSSKPRAQGDCPDKEIAAVDGEAALSLFSPSARALQSVSIEQFEAWAKRGLSSVRPDTRARRSYFSLRHAAVMKHYTAALLAWHLDQVQHPLRLYVEALTRAAEVDVAALAAVGTRRVAA